jgi:hypothetical protein
MEECQKEMNMSKKARSRKKAPAIGPRIVRAWFDTVINPLLNGLEKEQQLLAQQNWTWEFSPPSLEAIHRVQAYVDRNNLEHFTQHYPEVARAIEEHDQQQLLLLQHCQQLQSLIAGSPELLALYQQVTTPEALADVSTTIERLFSGSPQEQRLNLLAQYIVNHAGELPYFYIIAPLWNKHRQAFLTLLEHPSIRPVSEVTNQAGAALWRSVDTLLRLLKEVRQKLAEEHDVPYVEPTTIVVEPAVVRFMVPTPHVTNTP